MRAVRVALVSLLLASCGGPTTTAPPPASAVAPPAATEVAPPASAPRAEMPGVVRTAPPGSLEGSALAPLRVAPPTPLGGRLTKRQILTVMLRHRAAVRQCYERELLAAPGLAGKVVVRFVIKDSGEVASAEVASSTLGSRAVEECLTATVVKFVFPPPQGGGVVIVNYPYIFQPDEAAGP